MAPPSSHTAEYSRAERGGLTTSTYVSIGLVVLLISAALVAGQFMARVTAIESELRDVRVEVRQVRDILMGQPRGLAR